MTRTKSSIRNVLFAMNMSIAAILIGLIAQKVFIKTLDADYLGINGLFTSIVSMLALAELGLGSAIYHQLYKPVADNDIGKIKSLIRFYKNGYRIVAFVVLCLGVLAMHFLGRIVGEVHIRENINIIYVLFLIDIVISYLLTYKRALLYVDQNNHIISTVHLGYLILLNLLQVAALLLTSNYYLYLIIKIFMRLSENIVLTMITNRKYFFLKDKSVVALDSVTKSEIYKKIRGLSYHKIGTYVVLGTDNILISVFFGITVVGLYSNYLLVISAISMLMSQAFTAITASIGNLLVTAKSGKSFLVYKKIHFVNFWLSCLAMTSLLVIMNSFITLWIGKEYILPTGVLVSLSINLYVTLIRASINSFKEASGIFHQDRYVPIIESVANIIFSLFLLHVLGLAGIFLGTICSTLILHFYSYPKFVYRPIFKQNYMLYYKEFFKNSLLALSISAITYSISRAIVVNGNFAVFVVNILLCLVIPNTILLVIFRSNEELAFYSHLIKNILKTKIFART